MIDNFLNENTTQVSSVNGDMRGIFGQKYNDQYNMQTFYTDLLNLTEDIDEFKVDYNKEDKINNTAKFKRDIKNFISKEMNKLNIKYSFAPITKLNLSEDYISIIINIYDYPINSEKEKSCYEMISYSKKDIENAMDVYIDTIESHFKDIGIKTNSSRITDESSYKGEKPKINVKAQIDLYI